MKVLRHFAFVLFCALLSGGAAAQNYPAGPMRMVVPFPPGGPVDFAARTVGSLLAADFGKWNTPWGDINRFQRLNNKIEYEFDDAAPSTPVMFPSANWGSLASFGARAYPNTKKWYGTSGNSFVAAIEFGDRIKAKAVTAGGLNSVPGSKHFNDQAERYASGNLRPVYFYPNQLKGHTERTYKPGN